MWFIHRRLDKIQPKIDIEKDRLICQILQKIRTKRANICDRRTMYLPRLKETSQLFTYPILYENKED